MGMAASQGRLLFMTARLSNNEFEQQCVAQSKQRLADQSTRANDVYLDALNATQYKILTGYNGETPNYEAVTYNQLTGINTVAAGKQYIVSDNMGKIVVSNDIAQKFENANGDYNTFLKSFGYTQVEKTNVTADDVHNAWDKYLVSVGLSNPDLGLSDDSREHILGFGFARDYTATGTIEYPTYETGFITSKTGNKIYINKDTTSSADEDGYYIKNYEIKPFMLQNSDGTTELVAYYQPVGQDFEGEMKFIEGIHPVYDKNSGTYTYYMDAELDPSSPFEVVDLDPAEDSKREINAINLGTSIYINAFDEETISDSMKTDVVNYSNDKDDKDVMQDGVIYAKCITQEIGLSYEGGTQEQRELYDYAMAVTKYYATANEDDLKYDTDVISHYKNIYNQMFNKGYTTYNRMIEDGYMAVTQTAENKAFQDEQWLITQLKNGKLNISYYSAVDKTFVGTTLDDDESITEKEDTKKIAIAEQVYNSTMDRIESEDKRFDMQLNKLEAEHSALQTEYESVAKVISKNVEKSFNIFNA